MPRPENMKPLDDNDDNGVNTQDRVPGRHDHPFRALPMDHNF